MEKMCSLIISVEVYSFFNQTNDYVFLKAPLERIDEETYFYEDAKSFFESNKKNIYLKIRNEFERENCCSLTDISLGVNGVYIEKDGKRIRPLFKKIDIGDRQYNLEDIILKRLYDGNLKILYLCDSLRSINGDFDSFFKSSDVDILNRIEPEDGNIEDIRIIWERLKNSKRIYSLMRFLLFDPNKVDFYIAKDYFFENIPNREKQRESSNYVPKVSYRSPYKDD